MNSAILDVKDLSVRFYLEEEKRYLPALNKVSFCINQNEVLGIIGESGSGKSITLLSILGLLQATPGIIDGQITFTSPSNSVNTLENINQYIKIDNFEKANEFISKGCSINCSIGDKAWLKKQKKQYKNILGKQVSMIFQNPKLAFNPYYSIGKQISESILLHTKNKTKESAKNKAIDWLRRVKMEAPEIRYNNNPYGLSGGLCQRAMIAMALASEPQLLIADEPTTGLDATIQNDILALLESLKNEENLSMLIVSHDLNVMHRLANRVLVYYSGFIIEEGSTENILNLDSIEHHPYTSLLLNTEFNDNQDTDDLEKKRKDTSFFTQCPYSNHCTQKKNDFSEKCETQLPPLIPINTSHKIRCWKFEK